MRLATIIAVTIATSGCRITRAETGDARAEGASAFASANSADDNRETLILEMQSLIEEQEILRRRLEEAQQSLSSANGIKASDARQTQDLRREVEDMELRDVEINNRLATIRMTLDDKL